ncbi:MAG: 50S ribosomal protein L15 [Candidatus Poribacteria bacterium]|nr:50S ribosomal protein L15 [Candidatus Poribacteria bacterium]MDD9973660.1 50S ribosomal protein L15 [Candidatus Poribacteria bacterium]MDE0324561.1 50S ribosomal protein L15 [Candidatus Poribacteria bacterium]
MKLNELKPAPGANRSRKRVGRGNASGKGGTCGRGHKGQKSRSGSSIPAWFEGGQMPLVRRLPKRGPRRTAHKRVAYDIINVETLNLFEDAAVVSLEALREAGLIKRKNALVKILGDGELEKQLKVQAHRFSKSAIEKIESKGGTTEVLEMHANTGNAA